MAKFDPRKAAKYPIVCAKPFQRLPELAYNLWWSWHPHAQDLFHQLAPEHWQRHRNPVKLLRERMNNLRALATERSFIARYQDLLKEFDRDLDMRRHWLAQNHPQQSEALVAYFSPEFALHECLPIYSGGLGVLAGDHVKTASDLGVPLVGVGLLYRNGYFIQRVDAQGHQRAVYPRLNVAELPVLPLYDAKGKRLMIQVELAGRTVFAQAWLVLVGSAFLVLLDTEVARNDRKHRRLTAQLYGGDRDTRLAQEMIMGIGGVRALRAMGLAPQVWHLNEGHVAFLCCERIRELMETERLRFAQACEAVAANTVFTTHTPVPAGNETFALPQVHRYFHAYCNDVKIDLPELLALGLQTGDDQEKFFSMTVMALRLSRASNGVSQLHGQVSRNMWSHLWPGVPENEIPVAAITNGVHADTWMSRQLAEIYDQYLGGDWRVRLTDPSFWRNVKKIPNEVLWQARIEAKTRLIHFVRERLAAQYRRQGASAAKRNAAQHALDAQVLTIGFARRFAAYKRADLIFRDLARLERIVNHARRPVQIIFAGKAHPRDEMGQEILRRVFKMTQRKAFFGKIVFIEDYDMCAGRMLVQGVDLWLNNPRRPMEASGTSGQKVPFNAGLNLSILDGWWEEGYDGNNGWKFGGRMPQGDEAQQDASDAEDLYRVLENEVIPWYYSRDRHGLPSRWLQRVKASMATLIPPFNTNAMVQRYLGASYVPAAIQCENFVRENYLPAELLALFKELLHHNWPALHFIAVNKRRLADGRTEISAQIYLGELDPDWVQVEYAPAGHSAQPLDFFKLRGHGVYEYRLRLERPARPAALSRLRILPKATLLMQPHETGLIAWSSAL